MGQERIIGNNGEGAIVYMDRFRYLRQHVVPLLKPYARRIAVFGSFARGDDTESSDVDILVELKPLEQRPPLGLRWFALEEELSQRIGRRVELVSMKALSPHIRPYVKEDEVVIYEEG
jgi:predicted nucleotidyltransferase